MFELNSSTSQERFNYQSFEVRLTREALSSKRSPSFTSLIAVRGGKLIGEKNGSENGILAKFLESILGIAEHMNRLLGDEIERRANLEEEQRLANEQGMYMPYNFEWEFMMDNR